MGKNKPTPEERIAEADKLEAMIPNMRKFSGFGNNNHANAKAAVRVLREDLSEDQIEEEFDDYDDSGDNPERNSANDVRQWLDGESKISPTQDFKSCLSKQT